MKKKLLVILVTQPLNKFNFQKWNLNESFPGWRVIFLNLLNLENKELMKKFNGKDHEIMSSERFINILNFKHLLNELNKLPKRFFFINLSILKFKSSLVDKILSLKGGLSISFKMNSVPDVQLNFKKKINFLINNFNFLNLILKIYEFFIVQTSRFIQKKFLLTRPEIYIVPNEKQFLTLAKKIKKEKIIKVHSYDYELFMNNQKESAVNLKEEKFAVFIDDDVDGHFEYTLMRNKKKFHFSTELFWQRVDDFLTFIENKYNVKTVIAGHHRRNRINLPLISERRKFIFDDTINLVKNSSFVISRMSTSIHQAILYRKPILFLEAVKALSLSVDSTIDYYAKLLGTKTISLENKAYLKQDFKLDNFLNVNEKKYKEYEEMFIKPKECPDVPVWVTVIKSLDKLNKKINYINND